MESPSTFWCGHTETITDDDHNAICARCGAGFYTGPLRELDLIAAFDAISRQAGMPTITELRLFEQLNKEDPT